MAKNQNKKQTVVEKIADAVDHVLHPAGHESGLEKVESVEAEKIVESPEFQAEDYAKHPKFDKFKSTQGEN